EGATRAPENATRGSAFGYESTREFFPARTNADRASRHGRSGVRPASRHDAFDSTEYAGLGAGRGNSAVVHGDTRSGSAPTSSNTARANSYHVVSPPPVQCSTRRRGPSSAAITDASSSSPDARSTVHVGLPR